MKLICGVMVLACVPVAFAASNPPYPQSNVAAFVFEKLDVTTLPSAIRPKHVKGKKTFADYGYATSQLDEKEAHLQAAPDGQQINFRVLDQTSSGIYVCVDARSKDAESAQIQRVLLLKMKNADGLLKGRESSKEFAGCPVIGADSTSDSYGG